MTEIASGEQKTFRSSSSILLAQPQAALEKSQMNKKIECKKIKI